MQPLSSFLAKGGVFVTDIVEETTGTGFVRQSIQFYVDGRLGEIPASCTGSPNVYVEQWWRGWPLLGVGANFEVRVAVINTGSFDIEAAAVGVWVDIGTDRCWGVVREGGKGGDPGTNFVTADMEIRDKAVPNTIRATFTVDLKAIKTV